MEILLLKSPQGHLIPATEAEFEKCRKFKVGAVIRCEVSQMRNYGFFKKWWALAQLAFDTWTELMPEREYKGVRVQPSFDRFRRDLTIMAGYFKPVFAANGEVRLEADSISFAKMDEETFEKLYSATINAVLDKILANRGYTDASLRALVEQVLGFDR